MTQYLSNKLSVLYTVLIVMVVYIHSSYIEANQYDIARFLQNLTGGGICRIANCLFFCISGYLFARNIHSVNDIWPKLLKRARTLLLPYILWNIIFVLWYVVIDSLPGISAFSNTHIIEVYANQSVGETLYSLFIAPAAFQLWFLRDLMVMLLFTPLLWWIVRKQWIVALVLALASTFVYAWLIYFWLGIIIAVKQWDIENYRRPKMAVFISTLIYVGYAIYITWYKSPIGVVEVFVNIVGLYLVWSLYDAAARGRYLADKGLWKYLCGYSFFIYCFHEPAFNVIKKLALAVCGTSEPVLILFYYVNPWLMVLAAVAVAKILQRMTPNIYKILTGGR